MNIACDTFGKLPGAVETLHVPVVLQGRKYTFFQYKGRKGAIVHIKNIEAYTGAEQ